MPFRPSNLASAERLAYIAALALVALVIAALHLALPFRFPIPWPDETSFLAPAFELARHGTLYVWGMNPDRLVMWMPPAYFVALAALFKIFGYSFALARWASAACVLASLWLAGRLIKHLAAGRQAAWLHALAAAAFLSPYVLMSANIARMEALLCLVMLASLASCVRGLPVLGAALVAGAATIHFNAVFFTLPAAAWFAWLLLTRQGLAVRWAELAAAAAAAAILGAYGLLVRANFDGFLDDIGYQFRLKRFYGQHDPWHPLWPLLLAATLCLAVLAARRRVDGPAFCALYGTSFVLMATEGREIWYDCAPPIGFLLIAIALVASAAPLAGRWRAATLACLAPCVAGLLACGYRPTPFLNPLLPRPAMLAHALITPVDLDAARAALASLPPGSTVNFAWAGIEPFFLDTLDRHRLRWGVPQHSATDSRMDRHLDYRLQCDSPDTPDLLWIYYPRQTHDGRDTGCGLMKN